MLGLLGAYTDTEATMLDQFTMKPAARKQREKEPADMRIAATLDDIATALEVIAQSLARGR